MPLVPALLAFALLAQQPPANCAGGVSGTVDICLADRAAADAETNKDKADRERQLRSALDLYRKAASATSDPTLKIAALDAATRLLDPKHLNEPAELELLLREMIGLAPTNLAFMFRLARLEEDQGQLDAAEDTLLTARRQQPEELDPYKMLAQFYARRATAISTQAQQAKSSTTPPEIPGTPDKDGIYRIGAGVKPAQRVENPVYPDEAQNAGISGAVQAEIVVNEQGLVTDATIVKSVPLLDDAALNAVKQWHFRPAVVNGEAVPIRMLVTVSFSLSQ